MMEFVFGIALGLLAGISFALVSTIALGKKLDNQQKMLDARVRA